MPLKSFKKEAGAGLPVALPLEDVVEAQTSPVPAKKKGRPKGSTKNKLNGKQVRDKILGRFQIDEFLTLVDTDERVKRYFYLELIPKLLPKLSEKEVEEKFGVSFVFGDRSEKVNKEKEEKKPAPPMKLTLGEAPKPEGM